MAEVHYRSVKIHVHCLIARIYGAASRKIILWLPHSATMSSSIFFLVESWLRGPALSKGCRGMRWLQFIIRNYRTVIYLIDERCPSFPRPLSLPRRQERIDFTYFSLNYIRNSSFRKNKTCPAVSTRLIRYAYISIVRGYMWCGKAINVNLRQLIDTFNCPFPAPPPLRRLAPILLWSICPHAWKYSTYRGNVDERYNLHANVWVNIQCI